MHTRPLLQFATINLQPLHRLHSTHVLEAQQSKIFRGSQSDPDVWQPQATEVPGSYAEVSACLTDPNYINKYYNQAHYKKLYVLETAMNFLAVKLAYRLVEKQVVRFAVQERYDRTPYTGIARVYSTDKSVYGTRGCVAHCLLPGETHKDVIIVFRGTMKQASPSGLRANAEIWGVGRSAFEEVRAEVTGWVQAAHDTAQKVHIVGHSLGGVCGLRLLASLPPSLQAICTMHGAAVTRTWNDVVHNLVDGGRAVFIVNGPRDVVCYGGDVWPPAAQIVCVRDAGYRDHCVPFLARQAFNGEPLSFGPYQPSWMRFLPVETCRKLVGLVWGHHLRW